MCRLLQTRTEQKTVTSSVSRDYKMKTITRQQLLTHEHVSNVARFMEFYDFEKSSDGDCSTKWRSTPYMVLAFGSVHSECLALSHSARQHHH